MNSAVHCYLVLAYTDDEKVALNVGFYYMANWRATSGNRPLWPHLSNLGHCRLSVGFDGLCPLCWTHFPEARGSETAAALPLVGYGRW